MKYVSIDIETTGLSCETNDMIEFAAVIEDTENLLPIDKLPTFSAVVINPKDIYTSNGYCLCLHTELYKKILKFHNKLKENKSSVIRLENSTTKNVNIAIYDYELILKFKMWLWENKLKVNEKIIPAGKNFFGFDINFIEKIDKLKSLKFSHRALDPTALFMLQEDKSPPALDECAKRAGIEFKADGYHTALSDALMVVELIRKGKKWIPSG